MFKMIAIAAVTTMAAFSYAQQAATTLPEPQYSDRYNAEINGGLTPLEEEKAMTQNQSHRFMVITPNIKTFKSIPNPASPVRVGPNARFVVKMMIGDIDPQTRIQLVKLTTTKKDREILIMTTKQSLIPGGGVKQNRAPEEGIAVSIQKYGTSSYEIVPQTPLAPGEYAFSDTGVSVQCFGVDAGGPSSPAAAQAPPPPPPPPPTPPKPAHPAAAVVDLPAASPGYPALHASAPAEQGCWWAPFVGQKLGMEFLYETCERGKGLAQGAVTISETANGIAAATESMKEPAELFIVLRKPAAQTITTAIRQQFILKLTVPAARTSCQPVLDRNDKGPGEMYTVVATGPYSKLKKFNSEDSGEEPCPGLQTNDAVAHSFRYLPAESKTKFIFFGYEDFFPVDEASIHFLAE